MNENKTLGNVLFCVGSIIIGIPIVFWIVMFAALSGFSLGSAIVNIIVCGLISYIIGKIRPNLSWKSGLCVSFGFILVFIFLILMKSVIDPNAGAEAIPFFLFLLILLIINPVASYLGSHFGKSWEGKVAKTIFTIIVLLFIFGIGTFLISGFRASQNIQVTPVLPPQPISN